MRVNFGPSFILRPTTLPATVNAVSELQPMSYEDRKVFTYPFDAEILCIIDR